MARKPLLGIPPPDYGLVGRWFGHMAHGRFRHDSSAAASPVLGEQLLGWTTHYLIGIGCDEGLPRNHGAAAPPSEDG